MVCGHYLATHHIAPLPYHTTHIITTLHEPTLRASMVLRQLAPAGTQDHPRADVHQSLALVALALAANEAETLLDATGLALTAVQALSSHNQADAASEP